MKILIKVVFTMELTFDEIVNILVLKIQNPSLQVFQLPPGVYEIIEIVNTVPSSVTVNTDEVIPKVFLTVPC